MSENLTVKFFLVFKSTLVKKHCFEKEKTSLLEIPTSSNQAIVFKMPQTVPMCIESDSAVIYCFKKTVQSRRRQVEAHDQARFDSSNKTDAHQYESHRREKWELTGR
jgi:hypothetical protein